MSIISAKDIRSAYRKGRISESMYESLKKGRQVYIMDLLMTRFGDFIGLYIVAFLIILLVLSSNGLGCALLFFFYVFLCWFFAGIAICTWESRIKEKYPNLKVFSDLSEIYEDMMRWGKTGETDQACGQHVTLKNMLSPAKNILSVQLLTDVSDSFVQEYLKACGCDSASAVRQIRTECVSLCYEEAGLRAHRIIRDDLPGFPPRSQYAEEIRNECQKIIAYAGEERKKEKEKARREAKEAERKEKTKREEMRRKETKGEQLWKGIRKIIG